LEYFFFDTSALTKRYQVESGSHRVSSIFANSDSVFLISHLGDLEAKSALAMKVRTGEIDPQTALASIQKLTLDVTSELIGMVPVRPEHFGLAGDLVEKYGFSRRLRSLDAIQLAVALDLRAKAKLDWFVVADQALADFATLEGLPVLNPETD
jgi:hypothetical protein